MTTYLINHLRQPGKVNSEVLDYLDQVQPDHTPGKYAQQIRDASAEGTS